jgi:hypothetical protein
MGYGCLLFQVRKGFFFDVTAQTGLTLICGQYTGWGGGLIDFDNDGYLDTFIANGDAHHLYTEEDVLARFDGKGRFHDVARSCGEYFRQKYVGRGAAFADYDDDGDIDILVLNLGDGPRLLRNDGGNRGHWLKVVPKLVGGKTIAIGATVTVTVGEMKMVQPVMAVNGYLSSSDPRPNFGLGKSRKADRVEVRWPDGRVQTLTDVPADRVVEVVDGQE